ncbi:hypothetical protein CDAR_599991 [Caerostris darwini]|uniref:Uncharacterized protein n=1 Tax=Caerostris darwini TaxID=1538125 RepID=A0AAV4RRF0_9ARAC|nr:hypothetical protein CDAR_599991 [Caerostris darwini]
MSQLTKSPLLMEKAALLHRIYCRGWSGSTFFVKRGPKRCDSVLSMIWRQNVKVLIGQVSADKSCHFEIRNKNDETISFFDSWTIINREFCRQGTTATEVFYKMF